MAALRAGAELAHIICTGDAAQPIKSYSPDLIVYPYLPAVGADRQISEEEMNHAVRNLQPVFNRLGRAHIIVIGPGLSTAPGAQYVAEIILMKAIEMGIFCILDGDGLRLLERVGVQSMDRDQGRLLAITPNLRELSMILSFFDASYSADARKSPLNQNDILNQLWKVPLLSKALIISKGPYDLIQCADQRM
jgi:ATP-dependent NAD(P)H-hydrate dehydratase